MIFQFTQRTLFCSIHDLAHISTLNYFTDCVKKASTKRDNLILIVTIRKLFLIDDHLNFTTLMEKRTFLFSWSTVFIHRREKMFFLQRRQEKNHFM